MDVDQQHCMQVLGSSSGAKAELKGTASLGEHRGAWCNVAFARHEGLAPRRSGAIQIGKTGAGAQPHQGPYKMERKTRRQVQHKHNRQSLAHSSLHPFVSFSPSPVRAVFTPPWQRQS